MTAKRNHHSNSQYLKSNIKGSFNTKLNSISEIEVLTSKIDKLSSQIAELNQVVQENQKIFIIFYLKNKGRII